MTKDSGFIFPLQHPKFHRSPLTLSFVDKGLELSYLNHYFDRNLWQARIAILLALLLYNIFALLDGFIVPNFKFKIWTIRFFIVDPIFIAILILSFTRYFRETTHIAMTIFGLVGGLGIVAMISIAHGFGSYVYPSGLMLVIFWQYILSTTRFIHATFSCVILIIAFNAVVLLDENHPVYIAINNNFFIISSMIIAMFAGYLLESYSRSNFIKTLLIDRERKDNEQLLLNILPQQVAEELKKNPKNTACGCHEVTILFADLVDFTAFSTTISPDKIVEILNLIFSLFDHLIDQNGLEKIKTIGDSYMAAGGLPMPRPDHAEAVADMALNILKVIEMFNKQYNYEFNLRIGIHSGPVVAGVIGKKKFIYDVWGDTVNTASRMESYSLPGHIQVSADTYQLLKNKFSFQRRGLIDIKGKGKMETYFLIERA